MFRNQLYYLLTQLAYVLYAKFYGIRDKPFEEKHVYLSDKDNDWNALALSTKEHAGHLTEITLRASESVRISKENNQWNKLAIELQAGKRDVDCQ